jgi:hypothetical protein
MLFSAGLEARLYVSQDGRRYNFQTGYKITPARRLEPS